ncbi:MAG: hypothetical protein HYV03_02255 [Deltaproteobacteria bacterium]|nr:hypothetical protein [Deltaproteobacteria bacterium]
MLLAGIVGLGVGCGSAAPEGATTTSPDASTSAIEEPTIQRSGDGTGCPGGEAGPSSLAQMKDRALQMAHESGHEMTPEEVAQTEAGLAKLGDYVTVTFGYEACITWEHAQAAGMGMESMPPPPGAPPSWPSPAAQISGDGDTCTDAPGGSYSLDYMEAAAHESQPDKPIEQIHAGMIKIGEYVTATFGYEACITQPHAAAADKAINITGPAPEVTFTFDIVGTDLRVVIMAIDSDGLAELPYRYSVDNGEFSEWGADPSVTFPGFATTPHLIRFEARDALGNIGKETREIEPEIVISPEHVVLYLGQGTLLNPVTRQFSAACFLRINQLSLPISCGNLVWSLSKQRGTVTAAGLYTAPSNFPVSQAPAASLQDAQLAVQSLNQSLQSLLENLQPIQQQAQYIGQQIQQTGQTTQDPSAQAQAAVFQLQEAQAQYETLLQQTEGLQGVLGSVQTNMLIAAGAVRSYDPVTVTAESTDLAGVSDNALIVLKAGSAPKPNAFIDSITPNPAPEDDAANGGEIAFTGHGTGGSQPIVSYSWFQRPQGGGAYQALVVGDSDKFFRTGTLTQGAYEICLKVTDSDSIESDCSAPVTLTVLPPPVYCGKTLAEWSTTAGVNVITSKSENLSDGREHFEGTNGKDVIIGYNDYLIFDFLAGGFVVGPGDYIEGKGGDDCIYGRGRFDDLFGGDGNDEIHGGDDEDYIRGGGGDDTIYGENALDELYGDDGMDYIYGGPNVDYIYGNDNSYHLYGEDGNDHIYGGVDDDYIDGGPGGDTIEGNAGEVWGGGGGDVIQGNLHRDIIHGQDGDDSIYGGWGHDDIFGYAGTDTCDGNANPPGDPDHCDCETKISCN